MSTTSQAEVLRVLAALDAAGCTYWLQGGWGVDALVGDQTRPHRDLDIDVDRRQEAFVLSVLGELGYVVETDWRPTRVELAGPHGAHVDVHPLELFPDGSARQADLEGGWWDFPASYFGTGTIGDRVVPCMTVEAQRRFHEGYEPREVDALDLAALDRLDGGSPH